MDMSSSFVMLFIFLGLLSALIVITEVLHRVFKLPAEQSRKFLHVSGGLMCLLFPRFFDSHWWVLILAAVSFLLLLITFRRRLLGSIHKTKRKSIGSVLFPLPVYGCFLMADMLQNNLFFYLPVSLLTIADTAAEMAGHKWGHHSKQFFHGQKTLAGSLAFFIIALPVCMGWLYWYDHPMQAIIVNGILISLATAFAELVTLHGWDNLSMPAVANVVLWLMFYG